MSVAMMTGWTNKSRSARHDIATGIEVSKIKISSDILTISSIQGVRIMKKISRRKFVVGTGAAVSLAAAGACMCPKTGRATITGVGSTPDINPEAYTITDGDIRIDMDKEPRLKIIGEAVKVLDEKLKVPLIIVQETQGTYIAVSIKCTHRGVEVEYKSNDKCFKCASLGGSRFKTDGTKIKGFASGPLKLFPASLEDNTLKIDMAK
jgi:Rieske Fe-S protein